MAAVQLSLFRPAAVRTVQQRQRGVRCSAAQTLEVETTATAAVPARAAGGSRTADIYIGHGKDEFEAKKNGQKGRVVVDDPTKYPARDLYTGGWAGGEQGLKDFVAAYQREVELNGGAPVKKAAAKRAPQPSFKGSDTIYVGNGRVITDDARKYPTRNELTGGFAGGELGLTVFKEVGDVPVAPNGQGTKQNSPLITAFVLGLAAISGGLLLNAFEEVGSGVLEGGAPALPASASSALAATSALALDEQTKTAVTAVILAGGVIATVAGTQLAWESMASKVKAGATKLAVLGGFWIAVFLAAKLVLES